MTGFALILCQIFEVTVPDDRPCKLHGQLAWSWNRRYRQRNLSRCPFCFVHNNSLCIATPCMCIATPCAYSNSLCIATPCALRFVCIEHRSWEGGHLSSSFASVVTQILCLDWRLEQNDFSGLFISFCTHLKKTKHISSLSTLSERTLLLTFRTWLVSREIPYRVWD